MERGRQHTDTSCGVGHTCVDNRPERVSRARIYSHAVSYKLTYGHGDTNAYGYRDLDAATLKHSSRYTHTDNYADANRYRDADHNAGAYRRAAHEHTDGDANTDEYTYAYCYIFIWLDDQ